MATILTTIAIARRCRLLGVSTVVVLLLLGGLPPGQAALFGQAALPGQTPLPPDAIDPPAWPRSGKIYPAPEPFSLNGYDALQAMAIIRREGLLIERTGDGREIVVVDSIEAVPAEPIEDYPPQHQRRWDLLLNGEPLRWDTTYIEYGGRLLSLRLLFTYRNQRPVPDIPYVLE
ncbi:MAG: hypothetical protein R6U25_08530 [Alkalispirochaeta sp.]